MRASIKADGSDECRCSSCQQLEAVSGAIGACDAIQSTLNEALSCLSERSDPNAARRLLRLARTSAGEAAHRMRQAVGERAGEEFAIDPEFIEQDVRDERWHAELRNSAKPAAE